MKEKKNETKVTDKVPKIEKSEIVKKEQAAPVPFFVEAEKMFETFAKISSETARKAFEYFSLRGGEFGREIDDWFKAESELLRFIPVEITESNGTVKVTADVAGFKPEEVEISVKDNVLMISGESEKREEKKAENVVYSDFKSDRFFRTMTLPEPVNADDAKAEIKNGILNISLPKSGTLHDTKRIAVSTA